MDKSAVADFIDRVRVEAVGVLAQIPETTATSQQAVNQIDRAIEALHDGMLVASFEKNRQQEARARLAAKAEVDRALPKPSVKKATK